MTSKDLCNLVEFRIAIYLQDDTGFSHKYEGIVGYEKVVFEGKNLITLRMKDVIIDNKKVVKDKLFTVKQTLRIKKWRIVKECL